MFGSTLSGHLERRVSWRWAVGVGLALGLAMGALADSDCIPPVSYHVLPTALAGADDNGEAALGSYERISPDGRFVLRSFSGARFGQVSLIELPEREGQPLRAYRTPLSNEAFPVQGSWRYLVDVNGEHYRFTDVLRQQQRARPLFQGGMTGFYAAASELDADGAAPVPRGGAAAQSFYIRSLSWPQGDAEMQGTGPLQIRTVRVSDDGQRARIVEDTGPQFICTERNQRDGNVYGLPMISIDGREFSAMPQSPREGRPSMRVYGLSVAAMAPHHACDLRADLGFSPGKAVFGFPSPAEPADLTYTDNASIYFFDRRLGRSFLIDEYRRDLLASAFPGLTRDGRIIAAATWKRCGADGVCTPEAGYIVADPYQSQAWLAYWRDQGRAPPRGCITRARVAQERARFAAFHHLAE